MRNRDFLDSLANHEFMTLSDIGLSFREGIFKQILNQMEYIANAEVDSLIRSYPRKASNKLIKLREVILETARLTDDVDKVLETTKWGEPSYVTKTGSTIRMDWKKNDPEHYYLFFICNTDLVNTFRNMLGDELEFQGNRAIRLKLDEPIPEAALRRCISLALRYHKLKHLPMLGV